MGPAARKSPIEMRVCTRQNHHPLRGYPARVPAAGAAAAGREFPRSPVFCLVSDRLYPARRTIKHFFSLLTGCSSGFGSDQRRMAWWSVPTWERCLGFGPPDCSHVGTLYGLAPAGLFHVELRSGFGRAERSHVGTRGAVPSGGFVSWLTHLFKTCPSPVQAPVRQPVQVP